MRKKTININATIDPTNNACVNVFYTNTEKATGGGKNMTDQLYVWLHNASTSIADPDDPQGMLWTDDRTQEGNARICVEIDPSENYMKTVTASVPTAMLSDRAACKKKIAAWLMEAAYVVKKGSSYDSGDLTHCTYKSEETAEFTFERRA